MNKDKFNSLEVIDQVEFVNNSLKNNMSLTCISKDLNIGRSTISDRFKRIGYTYNKQINQYTMLNEVKSNADYNEGNLKSLKSANINDLYMYNASNTDVNSRMINIINEYETLMQIIELYKSNSNVLQNKIIIDLPEADSDLTSFRVNEEILQQFNEFVKKQKEFRKIDLVSMALKEYMENHS